MKKTEEDMTQHQSKVPSAEDIEWIPGYLVYEVFNGVSIPYKGYRDVMAGEQQIENIMGSSSIQATLVYIIGLYLGLTLNRKKYHIVTNEAGLVIDATTKFANDIAVYERDKVSLTDRYFKVPPRLVIEVDIKIDAGNTGWNTSMDYSIGKAQRLIEFGVERVLWVWLRNKKILEVTADKTWIFRDFTDEITLFDGHTLQLSKLLEEEGIEF